MAVAPVAGSRRDHPVGVGVLAADVVPPASPAVQAALTGVTALVSELRVLGTYPRADAAAKP